MRRPKKKPLRGSVTQNNARVRMQAKTITPLSFMFRLGALVGSVVIILGFAGWLWHIGWPQRQAEHLVQAGLHVTQEARFAVKDIVVEGRQQTPRDALSAALGTGPGAPILSFDPALAQERIAKLPWVSSVTVERLLPDTIFVRLTERQALARWQHEGRTVVIDMQGQELPGAELDQFSGLPLVVGASAPQEAKAFLDMLKNFPVVDEKMTAATRVSERRWDLYLQQKIVVKLPEYGLEDALKSLSDLITKQKILERDPAVVDMRLPDRTTIQPNHPVSPHPDGDMRL